MESTPKQTITRLLQDYDREDSKVTEQLFEHVYKELYKIACGRRHKWRGNETLNTTAILHEAYLKLVDQSAIKWRSRTHFYATASKAMRHILMNYARDQNRQKRGGDQQRISFEQVHLAATGKIDLSGDNNEILLMLDDALERLEKENKRLSEIVECRFFGGLTIQETADSLGVSASTVKRGWNTAQLWLYRELQDE